MQASPTPPAWFEFAVVEGNFSAWAEWLSSNWHNSTFQSKRKHVCSHPEHQLAAAVGDVETCVDISVAYYYFMNINTSVHQTKDTTWWGYSNLQDTVIIDQHVLHVASKNC